MPMVRAALGPLSGVMSLSPSFRRTECAMPWSWWPGPISATLRRAERLGFLDLVCRRLTASLADSCVASFSSASCCRPAAVAAMSGDWSCSSAWKSSRCSRKHRTWSPLHVTVALRVVACCSAASPNDSEAPSVLSTALPVSFLVTWTSPEMMMNRFWPGSPSRMSCAPRL